ncbi:MAG: ABC transporter permease [Candidatus Hinthialibacter sp.]
MQSEIFAYLFPGMMVMWVFFIGQTTLSDIYTERDRKTLMRLMAAPVTSMHIVLSKFAHCFLLCVLVEFVLILISTFILGLHWGNPFWLVVTVIMINFALTGVLALLYGAVRHKAAAEGLTVIVILGFGFLSGSFFSFEEMPVLFQRIGEWTVNRWAILGLRSVMNAEPLSQLGWILMKMFLFGFVTMAGGIFLLKRRLEAGEGV